VTDPVRVGLIGAGSVSGQYLKNLQRFPDVEVVAIGDIETNRAEQVAREYRVPRHGAPDLVLAQDEVEVIVNLTIPAAHAEVSAAILEAGKHVWSEKPLAVERSDARAVLETADRLGLRVGTAPDTFLGQHIQSARRIIQSGRIGTPVSAITMMQDPGSESWHPSPEFLYARGGGPLYDRGPYYLTMLVQLFGSMARVGALATRARAERAVLAGPRAGSRFPVEVDTNVMVLTEFDSGVVAQSVHSFETAHLRMGFVEINGSEGTLVVPDPNRYDGTLSVLEYGGTTWSEIPVPPVEHPQRGLGLVEMARAIRAGEPHRASGQLAYHVLDSMAAIDESVAARSFIDVASRVDDIPLVPAGWDPYECTL